MMEAAVFDLFFTLINPLAPDLMTENEYDVLGMSHAEFERRNIEGYGDWAAGGHPDPYEEMAAILAGLGIPQETVRRAADARMARIRKSLLGVDKKNLALLENLRGRGVKTALVSNSDAMDIHCWDSSPLKDCFDVTVFSFYSGFLKPDPRIYSLVLNRLGLAADRCLYCGDGGHGELKGARAAGFKTVLTTEYIRYAWPERIPALAADADVIVDDVTAVADLLSG